MDVASDVERTFEKKTDLLFEKHRELSIICGKSFSESNVQLPGIASPKMLLNSSEYFATNMFSYSFWEVGSYRFEARQYLREQQESFNISLLFLGLAENEHFPEIFDPTHAIETEVEISNCTKSH